MLSIESKMPFNEVLTPQYFKLHTVVTVVSILLLWTGDLSAQPIVKEDPILQLKQGTLIILLENIDSKAKAIKNATGNANTSRRRKRLENLLSQTLFLRDSFNLALRNAIENHYAFSKFEFIDEAILSDWRNTLSEEKAKNAVFFLKKGSTESGVNALILYDYYMKPLGRPYPYYLKTTSMLASLESFFGKSSIPWKNLEDVIKRWQRKLQTYYESS